MREEKGDIWTFIKENKVNFILCPVNGWINDKTKKVPFGAGFAAQIKEKYPGVEALLASFILSYEKRDGYTRAEKANIPYIIEYPLGGDPVIVSFPSKPQWCWDVYDLISKYRPAVIGPVEESGGPWPGWQSKSLITLIARSAKLFRAYIDDLQSSEPLITVLPRVGCGLGELRWEEVKGILNKYFDERFISIQKTGR